MGESCAEHSGGAWAAVLAMAQRLGFDAVGVCEARASDHGEAYRRWIAEGRHGEMGYLARNIEARLDPGVLLPGARSVICVADRYAKGRGAWPIVGGEPRGRVARYGMGRDYHRVIKRRLHAMGDALRERWPEAAFKACVDTAPLLEREHAVRAGLGQVGKHTLLIHPELGSWLLLGCLVTTLKIERTPSEPLGASGTGSGPGRRVGEPRTIHPPATFCGECTRCIDACPTHAITPWSVDATRCISYLTLEHRGVVDPAWHTAMGDWLAGCDVCQEVCPYNGKDERWSPAAPKGPTHEAPERSGVDEDYQPRERLAAGLPLLDVLNWSDADYRAALQGSALKRMKFEMAVRNAIIAAGNALARGEHPALRARIRELARADPAPPQGEGSTPAVATTNPPGELIRLTARQVWQGLVDRGTSGHDA